MWIERLLDRPHHRHGILAPLADQPFAARCPDAVFAGHGAPERERRLVQVIASRLETRHGRGLVLVSIKDATAAQAWFDAAIAKSGAKTTTDTYGGATLTVFSDSGKAQAALAVLDGKVVVAGDIVSVKAAIDTKGSGGFASKPGPKAALDSADGDHVGFAYFDLKSLLAWSTDFRPRWACRRATPSTGGRRSHRYSSAPFTASGRPRGGCFTTSRASASTTSARCSPSISSSGFPPAAAARSNGSCPISASS